MVYVRFIFLISLSLILCQCDNDSPAKKEEKVTPIVKSDYGITKDGEKVEEYLLTNKNGMEVKVITYGGIITEWTAPNKEGKYENVVLNLDSLEQYESISPYFGAIAGRYANRIAKGTFSLEGNDYELATNNGANHLHGGVKGFDKVVWKAEIVDDPAGQALKLSYLSADGEEGYPGNLSTTVIYTLTSKDELRVHYSATTDKKTVVNLTQHSYFNLTADFSQKILDHQLVIRADAYLPVDETLIPTGERAKVEGTPFDFTEPKAIGLEIAADHEQIVTGKGYDHCWVLNGGPRMREIASVYESTSGRFLEISTTEPGVQFYSGNFLDGTIGVPGGGTYSKHSGLCLETEHFPDSPNQAGFQSSVLEVGERYESETRFKFSVK